MARILAITNQKGGSGKTTTAVNLAALLAEQGRRVLLIDLDPQASCTEWLNVQGGERDLLNVFLGKDKLVNAIRPTSIQRLQVVPSSIWLAVAERTLSLDVDPGLILRRQIENMGRLPWDYVLIDAPPNLGVMMVNAMGAAGELIAPVEAHILAANGLIQLFHTFRVVQRRVNPALRLAGIVACRVTSRTKHSQEIVQMLRGEHGDKVFKTVIRENITLAEAPAAHQPINVFAPSSPGAEDYRSLATELMEQEEVIEQ